MSESEKDKNKLAIPQSPSARLAVGGGQKASLHQRVAAQPSVAQAKDRIALLLDCSGSMADREGAYGFELDNTHRDNRTKLELLKQAVEAFVQTCTSDTALALISFPEQSLVNMTLVRSIIVLEAQNLRTTGCTPMHTAMEQALRQNPTRCVIVSDGHPDSAPACYELAQQFASRNPKVACDCVHIGATQGGEEVMKRIAETTGGVYLKFEDVTKLVGGLKYLTPAFRAMLTSGSIDASKLGAKELNK